MFRDCVTRHSRPGFTLVELLVSMAVIILLASIALVVVPGIMDQDRTTDGAGSLRQWLMIAKARAGRDNLPRGIRLVTNSNPLNGQWVTEVQYTEAPPVLVPRNDSQPGEPASPKVRFTYNVGTNGGITTRTCEILNLNGDQAAQVAPGSVLALPLFGTWHKIQSFSGNVATLDTYPDAKMGAGTQWVTYHFGIYGAPRPLLGEPLQQLPRNICVDLDSSQGTGADIVFAPSGQVVFGSAGQIFLWVRDYTKPGGAAGDFRKGGEQQVVAIKSRSGSLGTFPIAWPPDAPFTFAQKAASAP